MNSVSIIDSMTNPFEKRRNDANQQASLNDLLEVQIGPIKRSKTKRIQDELIELILNIWVNKLQIC
jgi:hypothetical protein